MQRHLQYKDTSMAKKKRRKRKRKLKTKGKPIFLKKYHLTYYFLFQWEQIKIVRE